MEVLTIVHLVPIVVTFDVVVLLLLMMDVAGHIGLQGASCILDGLHLLVEDVAIDVLGLHTYLAHKDILAGGISSS